MKRYFDQNGFAIDADDIKFDELTEAVCPECHEELIPTGTITCTTYDGDYYHDDSFEVIGYTYYCPECGREFTLKEEL